MNAGGTVVRGEIEVVGGGADHLEDALAVTGVEHDRELPPPDLDETFEQGVSRNRIGKATEGFPGFRQHGGRVDHRGSTRVIR